MIKIKDLIKELEQFDPEDKLHFVCDIDHHRSQTFCGDGELCDLVKEDFSYFDDEEDEEVTIKDVVVVRITGEATSFE